jgi:NAD(P) transhydrogenase
VLSLGGRAFLSKTRQRSGPAIRPTAEELFVRVAEVKQSHADVVEDQLQRNDITRFTGEARFKDSHAVTVSSNDRAFVVTAANILIAVGTTPAPPPGASAESNLIVTSDELLQITVLPRRLTVVGAGIIGIEYASMFSVLGIDVTVIDKRDRLLEFLDREIVDELFSQMRHRDVTFRLGEAVEQLEIVEGPPRRVVLFLGSGKRLVSELVLFGAGRQGALLSKDDAAALGLLRYYTREQPSPLPFQGCGIHHMVPRSPLTCIIHDGSLERHSFCLKIWKIRTAPSL